MLADLPKLFPRSDASDTSSGYSMYPLRSLDCVFQSYR
jgi:hypothetical protein